MLKIANAFSLNMLPGGSNGVYTLHITEVSLQQVKEGFDTPYESFVGHADTAAILTGLLGVNIACVRGNLTLKKDDTLIVAQYNGPRLPEGTKTLPEGASFKFYSVTL